MGRPERFNFEDVPAGMNGSALQIMALSFSLQVWDSRSHWCPSTSGPPTCTRRTHGYNKLFERRLEKLGSIRSAHDPDQVFAPIMAQWQEALYWVTIASITVANLFAIRQQNLKRFMAFRPFRRRDTSCRE
jgi:NADH-quinone oxidoreductase subunit N